MSVKARAAGWASTAATYARNAGQAAMRGVQAGARSTAAFARNAANAFNMNVMPVLRAMPKNVVKGTRVAWQALKSAAKGAIQWLGPKLVAARDWVWRVAKGVATAVRKFFAETLPRVGRGAARQISTFAKNAAGYVGPRVKKGAQKTGRMVGRAAGTVAKTAGRGIYSVNKAFAEGVYKTSRNNPYQQGTKKYDSYNRKTATKVGRMATMLTAGEALAGLGILFKEAED